MIDIKERLRAFDSFAVNPKICKEAADHIEQLEAEIARLRKDAAKWEKFRRVIQSGHLRGAGHGNKIKIVTECPMYGEESQVSLDYVMQRIADTSTQEENK